MGWRDDCRRGADLSLLGAWQVIRGGHPAEVDGAWQSLRDGLSRLARGVTSNPTVAEELVAMLCLSLVRRAFTRQLPEFSEPRVLRGYLKASLEKAFASHLRQQAREREAHASSPEEPEVADAETHALGATGELRREERGRQRLAHAHRLLEALAAAAIDGRLPRYRDEARSTWAELKAVHLDHRELDDVIREADGPIIGGALKRARLRRYQAFRRFRERMLELARERQAQGSLTELDVRSVTALIGLELMAFQLSAPSKRRDPSSSSGA